MSSFDLFGDGGLRVDEIRRNTQKVGLTLAKVTNITDPDKLNRVKCKPVVADDDKDVLETEWCHVVQPFSGKSRGQFFMPGVDDLVLLAYLNGDPHCPYVMGGTWNKKSPAPYTITDGKNHNFCIKTPSGAELLFYEEKDKEYIRLKTPKGATLLINDEQQKASFNDPNSKNPLTINWKDGEVTIKAEKKMTLSAGSTEIVMESSGNMTLKADKAVTIKGADIKAEATNGFTGKGASANVEASGKLTLKGMTADLKGSAGVNIN